MLKILLVDDEDEALNILSMIFEDMHFHVITARDGLEAYELLERMRPDVVVSDYKMPHLNGVELYRKIQGSPAMFDLPFILVSGAPPVEIHSDVPVFLQKPIQIAELIRQIEALSGTVAN
jgi:CheY-like chemotaxis protein